MFQRIAPPKAGQCHSFHFPLPHQESAPLGHTFALPAIKGPLPGELKLRENTVRGLLIMIILTFLFITLLNTAYTLPFLQKDFLSHFFCDFFKNSATF